jgi:hypothetical protein
MSGNTDALSKANARWQVKRRLLIAQGKWQPFVEAEPVREHLRSLQAAGMAIGAVALRIGLPHESSLQHVMWGRGDDGPGNQVRRETAELVLSFWPSLDDFPDSARIDVTGSRRRVQALAVLGWPRTAMAEQLGMDVAHFNRAIRRTRIRAGLARSVKELYDAWWNQDPLEHGVPAQSVARVRSDSARAGLYGPLAWDDDTIDDPAARPQTDAVRPTVTEGGNLAARWLLGESVVLGPEDRKQVVQHLFEWTELTKEQIAERVEMTPNAAEQIWNRLKRKARTEGRPVPWRRVYKLRGRDLKQDEMEEVA